MFNVVQAYGAPGRNLIFGSDPAVLSSLERSYIGYLGFLGTDLFKSVLLYSNGAICLIKLLFKMGLFTVHRIKITKHICVSGTAKVYEHEKHLQTIYTTVKELPSRQQKIRVGLSTLCACIRTVYISVIGLQIFSKLGFFAEFHK